MIPPYKNKRGEVFQISFVEPPVPEDANYWGWGFIVTNGENRKRGYRVVVKKDFLPDKESAKQFATTSALNELRSLLEQVEDGKAPLLFPDLDKGWVVF